jgi:adenylyltransferase/sulfurtransferase
VFNYNNGPSYRCLFPNPPKPDEVRNCSEIGVIGILPGIIGTQQANEAIKIILGIGEILSGQLLTYNALSTDYNKFKFNKNKNVIDEIKNIDFKVEEFNYDFFCGIIDDVEKEIGMSEFKAILNDLAYQIIDLRDDWEEPNIVALNLLKISPNHLISNIELIDKSKKVVLVCQNGKRSTSTIAHLNLNFKIENLINLKNGLIEY